MSETNRTGPKARTPDSDASPSDKSEELGYATLSRFERPPLDVLTPAEREAYEAVEIGDVSGREFGRRTDRSWGTVSNLLMRAREKLASEGWA